jgi:O-acetyl-ADP-ribose deacetylase (regulator of RNase III)
VTLATEFLKLQVVATDDVREARTVPAGDVGRIEYNPNRPRERRRYSVAHEIAHTLFPDYAKRVRHRGSHHSKRPGSDDWQLEALCNIAAAEILMPVGTLPLMDRAAFSVDALASLRPKYDVSMEAVVIRAVHIADFPCAAFAAAHLDEHASPGRYRIEYCIPSPSWKSSIRPQLILPERSIVAECTAIGYMAKADETWHGQRVHVECVGIPPSPWSIFPRVAGLVVPVSRDTNVADEGGRIRVLVGNALAPAGHGPKVLVHVVNDGTPNWGGNGFAAAVRKQWPEVQKDFQQWGSSRAELRLGNVRFFETTPHLTVASIVAQRGYGEATGVRRLRYSALESCLEKVADYAASHGATVHMPRIGSGQGGASWAVVQELIAGSLSARGLSVTVYDLRGTTPPAQSSLNFVDA